MRTKIKETDISSFRSLLNWMDRWPTVLYCYFFSSSLHRVGIIVLIGDQANTGGAERMPKQTRERKERWPGAGGEKGYRSILTWEDRYLLLSFSFYFSTPVLI